MSNQIRKLLACKNCGKQYDVSEMEIGSTFRCICGETLTVNPVRSRDAAVIRCSWCGAPKIGNEEVCSYCKSEFTLYEKDLYTVCPVCFVRVSNKARFCHNCGSPIIPEGKPGEVADLSCPVCGGERKLHSRKFTPVGIPVMECQKCAGLWLGIEVFEAIVERTRSQAVSPSDPSGALSSGQRHSTNPAPSPSTGNLYRPCPVCGKIMNRVNFGRSSGVIIDTCSKHGVWFDCNELDSLIAWIKGGGLRAQYERQKEEEKESQRDRAMKEILSKSAVDFRWDYEEERRVNMMEPLIDLIGNLLSSLFKK